MDWFGGFFVSFQKTEKQVLAAILTTWPFREEQLKKELECGEKETHLLTRRLAQTEARLLEAEVSFWFSGSQL